MLKKATWADILRVAENMNAIHRRHVCATCGTEDPVVAIQRMALRAYVGVTIWRDEDEPIVAAGAVIQHPGVAATFMYATERWPEVVIETTRFFHRTLKSALRAAGVHRLQTLSMAGDQATDRLKQAFGSMPEAIFRNYGKNGEDFIMSVCHLQPPQGVT